MQFITLLIVGDDQLLKPSTALPKIATVENKLTKNSKSTTETPKTPCQLTRVAMMS